MNSLSYRIIGTILIIGAILGTVIALTGLVYTWRIEGPFNASISRNLDLVDNTLQTSAEGLEVISLSLEQTIHTVTILKSTSETLTTSLESTIPSIDQSSTLVARDLVDVVNNTISSLEASQASALLIDDTLRFITSLPLIGRRYAPSMPLGESIALIQESMVDLPESLIELGEGMRATANSMRGIQTDIAELSNDVTAAETSLLQSQKVISDYQEQVAELQNRMADLRENIPVYINTIQYVITVFLIWLIIAQIGLISQGINYIALRNSIHVS